MFLGNDILPETAGQAQPIWIPDGGAPTYTLLYDTFTASLFDIAFGNSTNEYYMGLRNYNDSVGRDIGKITYKLTKVAGDISGKSFTVRIWSVSGASLNSELASSTPVTGSNSWSATAVDFIIPFTITSGVDYSITIDAGSTDGSNYATGYYNTTGAEPAPFPSASMGRWRSDKTNFSDNSGFNPEMKLYTSP